MTTIEKLKQGCGKVGKIYKGIKGQYWYAACGKPYLWERDNGKNIPLNLYLCPICQAKLSQHQEDVGEFKKKIDRFETTLGLIFDEKGDYGEYENPYFILKKLKSSLEKDDEYGGSLPQLATSTQKDDKICNYCGGLIKIRNPTGRCDHLYYPENVNKNYPREE